MKPLAGTVLAIAAITCIPAACGWLMAPEGGSWTGLVVRNTADTNVYLAVIEETRREGLLAHNLFSPDPHPAFLFRPVYSALGLAGRALPFAPSLVLMEAGRIATALGLLALMALVASRAGRETWERVACLLVLALGAGIGWMGVGNLTTDLGSPEGSTFVALLSPPHFALSLALILGTMLALEAAWKEERGPRAWRFSLLAAGLGFWLGFEHPFDLVPLGLAVGGALAVEWARRRAFPLRALARALPLAATAGAATAIQFLLMHQVPVYAEWNRQHVVLPAPLLNIAASLGLLLPLALAGVRPLWRRSPMLAGLVTLYAAAAILCSRLPVPLRARFLEGYSLCFAVLACWGMLAVLGRIRSRPTARIAAWFLLAALVPSSLAVLGGDIAALARRSPPQYLPDPFLDGLRAAGETSEPDEVFLSSFFTGNFIPGHAARPVFLGHRVQTARFDARYRLVTRLLGLGPSHPEARDLIVQSGADLLFWGPEERNLSAGAPPPSEAPWLEPVWSNDLVTLFEVKP